MRQELKQFGKISGPLAVFIFVLVSGVGGLVTLGKRTLSVRSDLQTERKERMVLQERVDELRAFEPKIANISEQKIILALPPSDPLLVAVSQIRKLAQEQNLFLSDLSVQDQDTNLGSNEDLKSIYVNFAIQGTQEPMLEFFEKLLYSVPLMDFVTLSVERVNDSLEAQVSARAFWAPYPTSLPLITDPIQPLTESEIETIDKLNNFTDLDFEISSQLVAQEPVEKQISPFSVLEPQVTPTAEPELQQ